MMNLRIKYHYFYILALFLPLVSFDTVIRTLLTGISLTIIFLVYFRDLKLYRNTALLILTIFIAVDPIISYLSWEKVPSFIFGLKYLAIIIVGYEISKLDSDTIKKYLNLFVKIVLTTGFIGIVTNKSVYLNGVDRLLGLLLHRQALPFIPLSPVCF